MISQEEERLRRKIQYREGIPKGMEAALNADVAEVPGADACARNPLSLTCAGFSVISGRVTLEHEMRMCWNELLHS